MTRPLVPGLIAEGDTDERFLGRLIERQLAAMTDASQRCVVSVLPAQISECRTTWTTSRMPVRETEAWLLADRGAWARIRGSDITLLPGRPQDVEKIADPKKTLGSVLPRRTKPHDQMDYFDYMGRNVDLAVLARVPAFAELVAETGEALKGLGYL